MQLLGARRAGVESHLGLPLMILANDIANELRQACSPGCAVRELGDRHCTTLKTLGEWIAECTSAGVRFERRTGSIPMNYSKLPAIDPVVVMCT
ncbi:hypothetical protein C0Q70_10059 [Pomacea canaliculata]|uniref:Uncharacterized protein n=1 Tax=Pomacea canaliculata TaxID=400727 RepID=A0A2T7PBI6_POMCA|nr:hypothetical protein C0Q70_10059 [Pomacea canaliculata]